MLSIKVKGNEAIKIALNKAVVQLRQLDINTICNKSGAEKSDHTIILSYFNNPCHIKFPELGFHPAVLSDIEKILILHYLLGCKEKNTAGQYVTFDKLPNGMFYHSAFRKRSALRILYFFADNPGLLFKAGKALGGEKADLGDISIELKIFPNINIIVIFYKGDEEFPAEVKILFKDDIINYFTLDDIAVLGGTLASKLNRAAIKYKDGGVL